MFCLLQHRPRVLECILTLKRCHENERQTFEFYRSPHRPFMPSPPKDPLTAFKVGQPFQDIWCSHMCVFWMWSLGGKASGWLLQCWSGMACLCRASVPVCLVQCQQTNATTQWLLKTLDITFKRLYPFFLCVYWFPALLFLPFLFVWEKLMKDSPPYLTALVLYGFVCTHLRVFAGWGGNSSTTLSSCRSYMFWTWAFFTHIMDAYREKVEVF